MSYDRKLDQVCPHRVVEEALFLDASATVATPLRPISSGNSVEVRLNGAIEVPSVGVYTTATSVGSKDGPFTITPGVNDTMRLIVNNGPQQVVVIPGGIKIPPDRIASLLTAGLKGIQFFVQNQHIGFRTDQSGPHATVFIPPTATLAPILGIPTPRQWRGMVVTPGWTLVNNPFTLNDRPTRLVVFDEPLKGFGNYVELNYVTLQQECRRCGGTGVENDWLYGSSGEVVQVFDEALLIQEIQKLMYTVKGSNTFHNWYGTSLLESIGTKLVAGGILQNLLVGDIYQAFGRWQSIKRQQEENVGQLVSDQEFPFKLLAVDLKLSQRDPTVLFIDMTIQNRSQDPIQLSRGIRLPQPVDLLGSTQAQGIFRESLTKPTLVG